MGAFNVFLASVKGTLAGPIPLGGTLIGTSEEVPVALAQQIKGGFCVLPTIDVLVDMPYALLDLDMEIVVSQYELSPGVLHPRTKYVLIQLPPANTKLNAVIGYVLNDYWKKTEERQFEGAVEAQYAPNVNGKRPFFLPTEISSGAYQAGYPTDAAYAGANPADIIWVDTYDPLLNHAWTRQRISGTSTWGIPISINAGGDYEDNQYIDTIFRWVAKLSAAPGRPIQPTDYTVLPTGWQNTPGADYATRILTEDLYRSQALRNPYGVLKSNWDLPILVSSDPNLVRYGNTPGITDFLNDLYWRGYYTPGLDTHMATRPDGASSDWTITKIDQESGEYPDFVFKNFPIGITAGALAALVPTSPFPTGGTSPNDCSDSPPAPEDNKVLYMSTCTKYAEGSFKVPWSLWRRFDGLNVIQAVLDVDPGDTFYQIRNAAGALAYVFPAITLTATLYNGYDPVTTGFTGAFKWYRGATRIVFDSITRKATNLGVLYNAYHEVSVDGKSLIVNPQGVDSTQDYSVGINHISRPSIDYEATYQLKDTTDDGSTFMCDILSSQGTTFKNNAGLYRFDAKFYKGGLEDLTNVVFSWTIKNALGVVITGGLRNAGGASVGSSAYVATTVYVSAADVDQYATLELTAVFGAVTRVDRINLTDVADAEALEHLYWGTGSTDPGSPTDFLPRTLTLAQVLALGIGYSTDGTGKWYLIQRVGGIWGAEIQIRSEAARPNGGLFLQVYKNVQFSLSGAPATPAVPGSGSIVPAGWTQVPTAFTGAQDRTYMSVCFFLLRTDVAADPTVLTRANYNPSGSFSSPKLVGIDAPPPASPGADGANGWSPILAFETRSSDGATVAKVKSWTGGTGVAPAADTITSYVGATGLGTIANAINLKGPAGDATQVRPLAYFKIGTKRLTTPASTFTDTPGAFAAVTSFGLLLVTNSWNQARAFLIWGEMPVSNDSGSDSWRVRLLQRPTPAGSTEIVIDENYSRMDFVNGSPGGVHKIYVRAVVTIPAGQQLFFLMRMTQNAGGSSRYELGMVEAIGL